MKKKYILSLSLTLFSIFVLKAQEVDQLMKLVLENNPGLMVAREKSQTAKLRAGTGNTPSDPEFEFAYLYSDPGNIGNKVNIMVKQQVDFPTAYVHRSKLKNIRRSRAELEYLLIRQEILSEAQKLRIRQIHLNQLSLLLLDRLERAQTTKQHMEEMWKSGEVGALEYNQAHLMAASVEAEYEELKSEKEALRLSLMEMTGGHELTIGDTIFPQTIPMTEDSLLNAYRSGPGVQLYEQGRQEKERERSLARSEHMPKISAGYFSESIPAEAFRGFTVGISVPLWEKSQTIKTADAAMLQSEAELNLFLMRQEKELQQKLNRYQTLRSRIETLEEALGSANSLNLLSSSLEGGEISLTEYFYTSDFYFRNQQQMLRYQRDLLTLEAELLKIYL